MTTETLAQLDLLARVDEIVARLQAWAGSPTPWRPNQQARRLVQRLLTRLEPLRTRIEAPLVVATFGGTGVGKSSLVNALVGEEVTRAGRQRPTTTQPVLLIHPDTALDQLSLPQRDLTIVRRDRPWLRDFVLLDCPDPDTNETEDDGSNLQRLHQLLPFCDVLLYVSTQQKYRSARVGQELLQAAQSCRIVFVQTHADLDEDIRSDWRAQLESHFHVPEMFYVDSRRAFTEQQSQVYPTGDFGRLLDLLSRELGEKQRRRVREQNLLGVTQGVIARCRQDLDQHAERVTALQQQLVLQRQKQRERLALRLMDELLVSQRLWERRLLGEATQHWGFSPFAGVLRLWHSQASLLASFSLLRARTPMQMALIGAWQGVRLIREQSAEHTADQQMKSVAGLTLTESDLREAEFVVAGYRQAAELEATPPADGWSALAHAAADAETEFFQDASRQLDELIKTTARQNSGPVTRWLYEGLFAVLPGFLLYRIGKNFFVDSFVYGQPLLELSFYIPAALFFLVWSALFVMSFTGRLRRRLTAQLNHFAEQLAASRLGGGLFPETEAACALFERDREELNRISRSIEALHGQAPTSNLFGGLGHGPVAVNIDSRPGS